MCSDVWYGALGLHGVVQYDGAVVRRLWIEEEEVRERAWETLEEKRVGRKVEHQDYVHEKVNMAKEVVFHSINRPASRTYTLSPFMHGCVWKNELRR